MGGKQVTDYDLGGPREVRYYPRKTGASWLTVFVLFLLLLGLAAYGYLAFRRNNMSLAQLPGLQGVVSTLGGRMDATEAKLRDLTDNWTGLSGRVSTLEHKLSAGLVATRKQSEELVAQAEKRMQAQMNQRAQETDARIARIESNEAQDRSRIAQMQGQMQNQAGELRQELRASQDRTGRDLSNLHQQLSENQDSVHGLARQLTRERVNFEVARNSTVEVVPGISLTVSKTDVSYQRFQGYLSLTADGRTLRLRNVGAQQAVPFYSTEAERPYDLVVTRVNRDGILGYLLLPAGGVQG
jgi:chaperonin cofactor prefoldin